jgi:hypothetical protein
MIDRIDESRRALETNDIVWTSVETTYNGWKLGGFRLGVRQIGF